MDEKILDGIIEKYPHPSGRILGILREIRSWNDTSQRIP
jgi:hypothetical protein